jgi:uncharacterized protein YuzE
VDFTWICWNPGSRFVASPEELSPCRVPRSQPGGWFYHHSLRGKAGEPEDDYMAREILEEKNIHALLKAIAHLVKLPKNHMWLAYDVDADVVYLHFVEKPQSTHSEMREDGIILDYKGSRLVGLTILDASQRS